MSDSREDTTSCEVPSFSAWWTGICGLIFLSGLGFLVWASSQVSPLDRVPSPDRALSLVVSQTLDLEAAVSRLPAWEREIYRLFRGEEDQIADLIRWYEQLTAHTVSPRALFEMAVLIGEAGQTSRLRHLIREWDDRSSPFPVWERMLAVGYLDREVSRSEASWLQAHLAETVPDNWFYTRVAGRLAARVDDRDLLAMLERDARTRADRLVWRVRALTGFEGFALLCGILGLVALGVRWFQTGGQVFTVCVPVLPPGWGFRDGVAVLVRGGAVTTLLSLGVFSLPVDQDALQLLGLFVIHGPVLGLLWWYVLRPRGIPGHRQFGLRLQPGTGTTLALSVGVVVALNLVGGWVIGVTADMVGRSIHWTDWFEPHFAWGEPAQVGLVMFEYVVLAAFLEECVFRGVVFATCRCVLSWFPAALVSAALFAVAHGYSLVGGLTVLWSGVLWAWAYEKTGSLWPGILGHGVNNLLFSLMLLAFLR